MLCGSAIRVINPARRSGMEEVQILPKKCPQKIFMLQITQILQKTQKNENVLKMCLKRVKTVLVACLKQIKRSYVKIHS